MQRNLVKNRLYEIMAAVSSVFIVLFGLAAPALAVSVQSTGINGQPLLGQSGLTQHQMQQPNTQLKAQAFANQASGKYSPPPANFKPECPANLTCSFVPAAHQANDSAPFDYGNYAFANRPKDLKVNQIVIHETEGNLQSALANFQDPTSYVSVQYIVDTDGKVYQTVRLQDIAYQAGNFYTNMHSVGIEHVGLSEQKGITNAQYKASATLSKWLAQKFNFQLNRGTVVGHDNVAGPSDGSVAGMHWDPGPYWDWNYYMSLLGNVPSPKSGNTASAVTIYPSYTANQQALQNCTTLPCTPVAALPTNFLPLRSAPSATAPLLSDPYINSDGSAGTTAQNDWGDQAPTGVSYAVADRRAGWTAIWFGGQKAWFQDNGQVTRSAGRTRVVTAKTNAPVPVYGGPLPEPTALGWQKIPDQPGFRLTQVALTKYFVQPGQQYVIENFTPPDDYAEGCANVNCTYPGDGVVVVGHDRYVQISYNHRFAYVKLDDVNLQYLN